MHFQTDLIGTDRRRRSREFGSRLLLRGPDMHEFLRMAARLLIGGVILAAPAAAQSDLPPYAQDAWKYGRPMDEGQLRFCVDTRDPSWRVARDIGEAIAEALLLEPMVHEVESGPQVEDLEELYGLMLQHCYAHMGFKLVPGTYPRWLTLTRAYYSGAYVFVTANPDWQSLADVPYTEPVASTMGTRADLRFISYLVAQPADRRWPRFPMGTNRQALKAVIDETAAVALVWEPALWAARNAAPAYEALHVIGSGPLPETLEEVGVAVLAKETFLRTTIDQAIAALSSDGTIAEILKRHGFPGRVVP